MVCVLCGGVAACHRYGVCTLSLCRVNVNFKSLSSVIKSALVGVGTL